MHAIVPGFCVGAGYPNSDAHACTTGVSPTKPLPPTLFNLLLGGLSWVILVEAHDRDDYLLVQSRKLLEL